MNLLYKFQQLLNKIAEHPVSLIACLAFLIGWTACSILSKGTFDSGLGIENLIINGLSILLLFAANSKRIEHNEAIHDKLDQLHERITEKDSIEP